MKFRYVQLFEDFAFHSNYLRCKARQVRLVIQRNDAVKYVRMHSPLETQSHALSLLRLLTST